MAEMSDTRTHVREGAVNLWPLTGDWVSVATRRARSSDVRNGTRIGSETIFARCSGVISRRHQTKIRHPEVVKWTRSPRREDVEERLSNLDMG